MFIRRDFIFGLILIWAIVYVNHVSAQADPNEQKSVVEQEQELVDFNSIKKVLKNDMLESTAATKTGHVRKKILVRKKKLKNRYFVPAKEKFWTFMSEYWLVKKASLLKWDYKKPDYGIDIAFGILLENHGYFEKSFSILLLNTPTVTHFGLPTNKNEYIFLLSVPFIRTMDLSKKEIALLLFEDFIRVELGLFKKRVEISEVQKIMGINFHDKKIDTKIFDKILKQYDETVFDKGFNFQEQFEVTKRVSLVLKSDLKLWNRYAQLLQKIDNLIKTNVLYKKYNEIYPSPELQLNWLVPQVKRY
ncbi:MAG: hypothetical protein ISR65_05100 [Bacteriovoracaceae bacterium]|nr:hypothetical protein [Bacteriovoracaceae bacterium]